MLIILTGDVQTGKTRWLTRILENLEARGVRPLGVLAPGIWREHTAEDGSILYDKAGIDNILLPQGTRIPFACRPGGAQQNGASSPLSQSGRMQLQWAIDDKAIEAVNAHLSSLSQQGDNTDAGQQKNLLVIDELGRLELVGGQGLSAAVELLKAGSRPSLKHAIVIVRTSLVDAAQQSLSSAPWGGIEVIGPDDAGEALINSLVF